MINSLFVILLWNLWPRVLSSKDPLFSFSMAWNVLVWSVIEIMG